MDSRLLLLHNSKIILNDPNFVDTFPIEIPKHLWIETFKKATHPNIKNCESAVDLLLFNGISKDAEIMAKEMINLFNYNTNSVKEVIAEFRSKHSKKFFKVGTMELICKIYIFAKNTNDSKLIIELALSDFNAFVTKHKIFNERVPLYLWKKCFLIILHHQNPLNCLAAIDMLFHISEPDSKQRNKFIFENINDLNENEKVTWHEAVVKIKNTATNIKSFSKLEERSNTLKQICKLNDPHLLLKILINNEVLKNDKEIVSGIVSDDLWIDALKKCFELLPLLKMSTWTKYSSAFDHLFHLSEPESEERRQFIHEITRSMLDYPKTFHIGVASIKTFNLKDLEEKEYDNIVRNKTIFKKENVFNMFFQEQRSTQVVDKNAINEKLSKPSTKEILIKVLKELNTDGDKGKRSNADDSSVLLSKRNNFPKEVLFNQCSPKTIKFWGKTYVRLDIETPEDLYDFVIYFLLPHSGDIGIDSETGRDQRITLLQLATIEWVCIIDVQQLLSQISEEQWKTFFEQLLKKNLVGFSYRNDRIYLCKTFPHLQELFQKKVICIQKLTAKIINENPKGKHLIFFCTISSGSGLAAHAKAILNIILNKEQQQSDRTQRPLADEQKEYAYIDALIPVLIKEKLRCGLELTCDGTLYGIILILHCNSLVNCTVSFEFF